MRMMQPLRLVKVSLDFGVGSIPVGRLALGDGSIYFEYDASFIATGLQISPLALPLRAGAIKLEQKPFEGLAGVFDDSLPDGWGRLLFDRLLRAQGILPAQVTPLDRLAHVGKSGMGALCYEPDNSSQEAVEGIEISQLARDAAEVLEGASEAVLEDLFALNGSSAGARPKALIGMNEKTGDMIHGLHTLPAGYTPWIVKFPHSQDGADAGAIEYVYALMAKAAGIEMPDVHLFAASKGAGYFAAKRFDRNGSERYHMHSACGLLHGDFRAPALDYEDLAALTMMVTKDMRQVEKMYRLAVFNVLSHNRDDHGKNFSFLMDSHGHWRLSPAYDLTFSSGPRGEQSTMVMGQGAKPSVAHLKKLAQAANISEKTAQGIIEQTRESLARWPRLARAHGVHPANITLIESKMQEIWHG